MKRHHLLASLLDSRSDIVTSLDKVFDTMMNDSFPSFGKDFGVEFFGKSSYPKVDIISFDDRVEIHAEIPGTQKENVEVKVEPGNILCIRGTKAEENSDSSKGTYLFRELKKSSFSRKFALGDNLDGKAVTAKFKNGILEVNVPKVSVEPNEEKIVKVTIE